ncbi:MAG: hypothetical protein ACJ741_19890 [Pyrinomonadaceae bacterium]
MPPLVHTALSAAPISAQTGVGAQTRVVSPPQVTVFSWKGATQVPKKAPTARSQGRAAPPLG